MFCTILEIPEDFIAIAIKNGYHQFLLVCLLKNIKKLIDSVTVKLTAHVSAEAKHTAVSLSLNSWHIFDNVHSSKSVDESK